MSLKHKLIVITTLTCVSSLTLAGVVFGAWEWTSLRRAIVQDLSAHAEILADNCKAAITFHDPAEAGSVLRTVGAIPSVLAACVYTRAGELFAAHVRQGTTFVLPPPREADDAPASGRDSLVLRQPVVLNGELIGTVCLRPEGDR